jgi:hypothetical protein
VTARPGPAVTGRLLCSAPRLADDHSGAVEGRDHGRSRRSHGPMTHVPACAICLRGLSSPHPIMGERGSTPDQDSMPRSKVGRRHRPLPVTRRIRLRRIGQDGVVPRLAEQTAAVDPERLGKSVGFLSLDEMRRVDAPFLISGRGRAENVDMDRIDHRPDVKGELT